MMVRQRKRRLMSGMEMQCGWYRGWVLPVLAAGMVLAVGGIYVLQSLDPLSHAAPCAAASARINTVI